MDFLIKFAQTHESFRLAEIEALAVVEGVDLTVVDYSDQVRLLPCCLPLHPESNVATVTPMLRSTSVCRGSSETDQTVGAGPIHP